MKTSDYLKKNNPCLKEILRKRIPIIKVLHTIVHYRVDNKISAWKIARMLKITTKHYHEIEQSIKEPDEELLKKMKALIKKKNMKIYKYGV